jgi:RES domain-containing protein
MGEAWHMVKEKHAATAFSGEGAAKTGGRWNSRGIAMVYTSGTRSLATLESLVHLNPPMLFRYVAIRARFDDALVEIFPFRNLPADGRSEPPPRATKIIGDVWVREARSAVLALPSVITGELNHLINPAHPDFKKISIGKPEPYIFDPRLLT